ncbi:nuclear transport factor 2 family protein [Microvirga sp. BSC39]|uniref:YybH family protein n=1 Tax=Microvirga sp. BSC39 TaxID=1549810 RepID=UPI0006903498|nr:nuclear transport factor 2 family protein [Microvirga sp. BSC39]
MSVPSATRHILILATLIATSCTAVADPIDDQIRTAYSAWNAAFNKSDPKAVAAFYTSDASLLPATHDVIQGPDGVQKFFSSLFANGVTDHTLDLIRSMEDDKIVIAAAKWSAAGRDASGKPTRFGGIATHVFERQPDGSLKLKLHTFN